MLDTINGLPVHPLVVHGVVVLLPLAIIGTVLLAVRPSWRRRYGVLVGVVAVVATALVPVATSSGEELEKRVGDPGEHAELGDQLLWFALALTITLLAMLVADRLLRRSTPDAAAADEGGTTLTRTTTSTKASPVVAVLAVVAVVAAVAAGVQVYRVGDSGAKAVWGTSSGS